MTDWDECTAAWLNAKRRRSGRENTARAYGHDLAQFRAGCPVALAEVTPAHAEGFVELLRQRQAASATIRRKVAALRSLYRFATHYPRAGAGAGMVWQQPNPFVLRDMPAPDRRSARYPSEAEVQALIRQIPLTSPAGWRNLAIIYGLFATTRRASEWLPLRWGDITVRGAGGEFVYINKGGERCSQPLPDEVLPLIERSLREAQRWPLAAGDFVFVALDDAATRLGAPSVAAGARPLSRAYVNDRLQRYGQAAGIVGAKLHCHALRHAGARCRREQGADIWDLQEILGHADVRQTIKYTRTTLTERLDEFGGAMVQVLPAALRRELGAGRVSR